ncbi:hypothetical protein M440DRAFT_67502 [Trichoderma longibrachiatum ATCC 18648]|uniref:Transcription elongation factor SPT5 n=1 Tax=Trichoderma longibrachiatum ATCC 18648 TaxID=983965 RepID=A0A2T4BXC0_TRILO|nr:hypothetical protein M440DRAFT_67502 [Trichoderma longibrachiatum ATCC 18648]
MASNDRDRFDDSEDEEDFNPAPADMSDEEEANDASSRARDSSPNRRQEADDDEEPTPAKSRRARDEDGDEEEEEEDEEEEADTRGRHDDDDEEEEEEEDDEDEDDVQHGHRRKRQRDRRNAFIDIEAESFGDSAVVPKRLLLPSVDDPSIWAVRCKEGKEREVVLSIMKRVDERRGTKDELAITAAFERGGPDSVMKSFVYVETQRQTDILVALDGILNVYPHSKLTLVDIKDMPELLRVTKTPTLEPGAWVRLRKPAKHNGDLAQVIDVTENGLEARVRFIPRLDYGMRDEALSAVTADGKRKRAPGMGPRPPQRLFSEVEARKRHPRHIQGNPTTNTWTYMGEEFENGFQVKDVKIQQLVVTDVNPSLEEVTRFASGADDGTENLDLKALAASLKDSNTLVTYLPGDIIEVYAGEQRGVVGKATNVQGDIVTMFVTEGDLKGQSIEVPIKGLRKRFKIGDHVKVIGGSKFQDEVGTVVKISEDRVTLLTDHTNNEVTVFSKDLREASDIGGQGSLGQYELHDLVQLDPTTVGCIVKVDRESLVVLDQFGDTRQVMPSQIPNKLPKRKQAVAADREGSEIRLDDVVKEFSGQQRQGKIIHIHRSYVFLHTHATNENAGVFVTKASMVNTIAAKGGRVNAAASGPDLSTMNPALKIHKNGTENKPIAKTFGRDRAINQTVIIKKGYYKGLLGIVKDTTDTHARTPAWGVSAPTPGASGNDSWGYTPAATSSVAYDAPTPGGAISAPTPGALSAPTPGAYNAPTPGVSATPAGGWQGGWGGPDSAPTPAAGAPTPSAGYGGYSAPTPAAYAPETPAASGPRYTDDD